MPFDHALKSVAGALRRLAQKRGEALSYSRKSGTAATVYGFQEPATFQGAPFADTLSETAETHFVLPRQTGLVDAPEPGDLFSAKARRYVVESAEEYGPGSFSGDSGTTSGDIASGATGGVVTGRVIPFTGATFNFSGYATLHTVTGITTGAAATWTLDFTPGAPAAIASGGHVQWRNVRSAAAWRVRARLEPAVEKIGV